MSHKVWRNVRKDHLPRCAQAIKRAERDQTIAGADIQYGVTSDDSGVVQDTLPDRAEMLHRLSALLGVVSIAAMKQPSGPLIDGFLAHGSRIGPPEKELPAIVRRCETTRLGDRVGELDQVGSGA